MSDENVSEGKYPSTFYRVSLKAIIRNDKDEVLVCKEYDADDWSLPGGGWDHGETEKEALARELFEEVGYIGDFEHYPLTTEPFWLETRQVWLLWIVYDVKPDNHDFKIGEYSNAVGFMDINQFKDSKHRTEQWIYNYLKDK